MAKAVWVFKNKTNTDIFVYIQKEIQSNSF